MKNFSKMPNLRKLKRLSDPSTIETASKNAKLESESRGCVRLRSDFFNVSCKDLALSLLGKLLVRKLETGEVLKGRIVETECYPGGKDKASHSFNGRRTPANEPMYMDPGTSYVYMTYGMYYCLNISSSEPGGAVLIRAIDPVQGVETMTSLRTENKKKSSVPMKEKEITNGPSKLCAAMAISKNICNKLDMCNSDVFWVESDDESSSHLDIIESKRIGINSVGPEWANKLYRFYVYNNVFVSKKDVQQENIFNGN